MSALRNNNMPCVHTIEINASAQNNQDARAVRVEAQPEAAVLKFVFYIIKRCLAH